MTLKYIFALLAIYLLSTGCAKQQFSSLEKAKAIGDPVFGDNNDLGNPDTDLGTSLLCSDSRSKTVGYNLMSASTLTLRVVDGDGNTICENTNTDQLRNDIVQNKTIPIPNCASMTGNKYAIKLLDPNKKANKADNDLLNFDSQKAYITRDNSSDDWEFVSQSHSAHISHGELEVLYNSNKTNNKDKNCDRRASPLVVKTDAQDHEGIQLTSPHDGIWFDILGENSRPTPHMKQRISWVTKDSYQFLVLPDRTGQVRGIDQMFGDNTKGPDGQFADNGYMALAKYDSNKDGAINSADRVYRHLMLWSDKNRDGRSQKDELISLKDAGLIAIDLDYDDGFHEVDQYGNETRMKSVVKYSDNSYRLIFDLWFNFQGKRMRTY